MKKLAAVVAVIVLAVVAAGCQSTPPSIPFANGWSGTMTDQYVNLYGVSFGTQSDVWAIVTSAGSFAAGTALNVNSSFPNATVKLIDAVGDWIELSGTYSSSKFTGTWTSDVGVHGSFTMDVDTSVSSLALTGSSEPLSQLMK